MHTKPILPLLRSPGIRRPHGPEDSRDPGEPIVLRRAIADRGGPRDYMDVPWATARRVEPATDDFVAIRSRVPKPLMLYVMDG
jgi:hypothetical protein